MYYYKYIFQIVWRGSCHHLSFYDMALVLTWMFWWNLAVSFYLPATHALTFVFWTVYTLTYCVWVPSMCVDTLIRHDMKNTNFPSKHLWPLNTCSGEIWRCPAGCGFFGSWGGGLCSIHCSVASNKCSIRYRSDWKPCQTFELFGIFLSGTCCLVGHAILPWKVNLDCSDV